jgi:hypothetical protein
VVDFVIFSSDLGGGATAGIVVVVLAAIALIGLLLWFNRKKLQHFCFSHIFNTN